MSQANMTLGNVARTLFRANLNDALAALASCQSGTSRPTGIPAGGLWVNTTTATAWVVNLFDGTDDIAIGTLNTTTNVFTPSIANNSLPAARLALGAWTTVASAATVDLGAQTSRNIALSGTTGITSFGSTPTPDNLPFNIRSTGAITITHSANLICPGGANLTLAAGDTFTVVQEATGVWRIITYSLSALPAISGANLTGISSTGRLLRAPQLLTSGTSYTTPAGCNLIFVEVVGGGGGGGGGSGSSGTGNNGNNGGNSTFTVGGNTLTGNGGWAGTGGSNGSGGRAGNDGNIGVRASGGTGSNSNRTFGYNPFSSGGNGAGGSDIPGSAGQSGSNSGGESGGFGGSGFGAGAGGGAAASGFTTNAGGGGGGAGGKQETFLTVIPSTSYSYSIGAGGVGGGGSNGGAGGAGAQGCIRIWEYAI